jgi:hypothetical protein
MGRIACWLTHRTRILIAEYGTPKAIRIPGEKFIIEHAAFTNCLSA